MATGSSASTALLEFVPDMEIRFRSVVRRPHIVCLWWNGTVQERRTSPLSRRDKFLLLPAKAGIKFRKRIGSPLSRGRAEYEMRLLAAAFGNPGAAALPVRGAPLAAAA